MKINVKAAMGPIPTMTSWQKGCDFSISLLSVSWSVALSLYLFISPEFLYLGQGRDKNIGPFFYSWGYFILDCWFDRKSLFLSIKVASCLQASWRNNFFPEQPWNIIFKEITFYHNGLQSIILPTLNFPFMQNKLNVLTRQ